MVRLILTAILLVLLTNCGTVGLEPSSQIVQRALALQLEQTQQQLNKELHSSGRSEPPRFEINQVVINEHLPQVIQNLPAYRVRGTYDRTVHLPKRRVTQQQNPFVVYLQRQKEGKTWRLALPQSTGNEAVTWRTYLIE